MASALIVGQALEVSAQSPQLTVDAAPSSVAAKLEYAREGAAVRCPSAEALEQAVSRHLGYPVFERAPVTHLVRVRIGSQRRGLRAQVDVRSADGVPLGARELDSPSVDCTELASALVLAVGIALDPTRLLTPASAAPAPCPTPPACPACPAAPAVVPAQSEVPVEEPEPSAFRGIGLGLGLGAGLGVLPAISGVGTLEASAHWTFASLHLSAELHPAVRGGRLEVMGSVVDDPLEAQLLQGQLALCGRHPLSARWTLGACAVGSVGGLHSVGAASAVRDASVTAAVGAQARLGVALAAPWFIEARADLQANLVHTTLRLGDRSGWNTPPLWGVIGLLAGLRFS